MVAIIAVIATVEKKIMDMTFFSFRRKFYKDSEEHIFDFNILKKMVYLSP